MIIQVGRDDEWPPSPHVSSYQPGLSLIKIVHGVIDAIPRLDVIGTFKDLSTPPTCTSEVDLGVWGRRVGYSEMDLGERGYLNITVYKMSKCS